MYTIYSFVNSWKNTLWLWFQPQPQKYVCVMQNIRYSLKYSATLLNIQHNTEHDPWLPVYISAAINHYNEHHYNEHLVIANITLGSQFILQP